MIINLIFVIVFTLLGFLSVLEWILIVLGYYHPTLESVSRTAAVALIIACFAYARIIGEQYKKEKEKKSGNNFRQNHM